MNSEEQRKHEEMVQKAKARALAAEGNELLKAVKASQPASTLVGPDGKPVAAEPVKGPSKAELKAIREEMSAKVQALFKTDPMLQELGNVLADLYRALIWVSQDIAAHEGMTDALAAHMTAMCQEAIMREPIVADVLISDLKKHTIPCLIRLKDIYARMRRKQQAKVNRINKDILAKGASIPGSLAAAGLKQLKIGESIVVRGEAKAVQAAVRQLLSAHEALDGGKTCLLSAQEEKEAVKNRIVMPSIWWRQCAKDVKTMDEVLSAAAEATSTMLGVDDINCVSDNVGQGVARLHSWCVNSLAIGVFGEPSDGAITFEGPFKRYIVTAGIDGQLTYAAITTGKMHDPSKGKP